MARVGIIGDAHEPFTHPMYRPFCVDTFEQWGVDEVVNIGDMVDAHAWSFWEQDANGLSAESEAALASVAIAEWVESFPSVRVCIGNHCERHFRMAAKAGLPRRFIRDHAEVWGTPNWKWEYDHIIDDVFYTHGTGTSGKDAAINAAIQRRMSLVMGHTHTYAGVKYHCNPTSRIFGMNVGCGIDLRAYAFEYGKNFPVRPVLGCGIVIDGKTAFFEPMPCAPGEKYHRRRAPARVRRRLERLHEHAAEHARQLMEARAEDTDQ